MYSAPEHRSGLSSYPRLWSSVRTHQIVRRWTKWRCVAAAAAGNMSGDGLSWKHNIQESNLPTKLIKSTCLCAI